MVSKPLLDLFLLNSTSKNLEEDQSYEHTNYLLITLYASSWIHNSALPLFMPLSPSTTIIASDASIKNNVATLILHIHMYNRLIIKMIHHAVHITSTEAELFAIRCSINQTSNFDNMSKIIVAANSIHVARKIFELSVHPYQIQLATILSNLYSFFEHHENNSIEFWECPSHLKWHLYNEVDEETKTFNPTPLYPCKMLWDFSKKSKSNDILKVWKMTFQASDLKRKPIFGPTQ